MNELVEAHLVAVVKDMAAVPGAAATAKYVLRGLSDWATDQGL